MNKNINIIRASKFHLVVWPKETSLDIFKLNELLKLKTKKVIKSYYIVEDDTEEDNFQYFWEEETRVGKHFHVYLKLENRLDLSFDGMRKYFELEFENELLHPHISHKDDKIRMYFLNVLMYLFRKEGKNYIDNLNEEDRLAVEKYKVGVSKVGMKPKDLITRLGKMTMESNQQKALEFLHDYMLKNPDITKDLEKCQKAIASANKLKQIVNRNPGFK